MHSNNTNDDILNINAEELYESTTVIDEDKPYLYLTIPTSELSTYITITSNEIRNTFQTYVASIIQADLLSYFSENNANITSLLNNNRIYCECEYYTNEDDNKDELVGPTYTIVINTPNEMDVSTFNPSYTTNLIKK